LAAVAIMAALSVPKRRSGMNAGTPRRPPSARDADCSTPLAATSSRRANPAGVGYHSDSHNTTIRGALGDSVAEASRAAFPRRPGRTACEQIDGKTEATCVFGL